MRRWLHTHRDALALVAALLCGLLATQINDDRTDAALATAVATAPQEARHE